MKNSKKIMLAIIALVSTLIVGCSDNDDDSVDDRESMIPLVPPTPLTKMEKIHNEFIGSKYITQCFQLSTGSSYRIQKHYQNTHELNTIAFIFNGNNCNWDVGYSAHIYVKADIIDDVENSILTSETSTVETRWSYKIDNIGYNIWNSEYNYISSEDITKMKTIMVDKYKTNIFYGDYIETKESSDLSIERSNTPLEDEKNPLNVEKYIYVHWEE